MTSTRETLTSASTGTPFLTGPTLYLRGVVPDDTKTQVAWHPSPYPVPAEVALKRLEDEVPEDAERYKSELVAVRRSDDQPAGSATIESWDHHTCWLSLYANPVSPEASAVKAELIAILVPWLLHEREMLTVTIEAPEGDEAIASAARQAGMQLAFRLREAARFEGTRQNLICWEALHPAWVERLGMPEPFEEGPVEREVKSPAPPRWTGPAPKNAFAVGERLYLRPIEKEDAEEMARWSAWETDTFHDNGRHIRSPIGNWNWHRKKAEAEVPNWTRFAIVAKKGDVLIGANGLAFIDPITRTAETETEIVRPDYRGAGYGTEAKHLLLEYGFERLGLHMVYSFAWEFNTRSWQALLKQGYRRAGRLVWTGIKDAQFVGDYAFDLLADEWRAARRR
jgi:RimJ/RimL family protein N-acetyltransferase